MNFVECVSLLGSCIAVAIAFATLQQNRNIIEESNRAYIVFYIEKRRNETWCSLVIKNFGKSSGILKLLQITPNLDYSKTKLEINWKPITDYSNVFFAPGQSIRSIFLFDDAYPDKEFNILVEYESNNRTYKESYPLTIDIFSSYLEANTDFNDSTEALKAINGSIRELSERVH